MNLTNFCHCPWLHFGPQRSFSQDYLPSPFSAVRLPCAACSLRLPHPCRHPPHTGGRQTECPAME
eukprot:14563050-Alexandrium_andersonii.AAC.1